MPQSAVWQKSRRGRRQPQGSLKKSDGEQRLHPRQGREGVAEGEDAPAPRQLRAQLQEAMLALADSLVAASIALHQRVDALAVV